MKKTIGTLLVLAMALTGCLKEDRILQETSGDALQPTDSVWTLTLQAEKELAATKGLAIGDGGEQETTVLQSIWKTGEKVEVYQGSTHIGTLTATPDGSDAHKATLSGTVTTSSISPGSTQLTLLAPRKTWDYTGQVGFLLKQDDPNHSGSNNRSVENRYHYTMGENVLVTEASVDGEGKGTLTMPQLVTFRNQQSIYRLTFRTYLSPSSTIEVKRLAISAASGGLVRKQKMDGTITTGSIFVNLDNPISNPIFVSLRNLDTSNEETLIFRVVDNEGVTYFGSKTIPAEYKPNGTFVSLKNFTLTSRMQLEKGNTTVNVAL